METSRSMPSLPSSSLDLVNFNTALPLIIDPNVKAIGINVEETTIFASNLMPCKFVFRTLRNETITLTSSFTSNSSGICSNNGSKLQSEYSVIYKIGDDLRQDQLVLQMIALMDKVNKHKNRLKIYIIILNHYFSFHKLLKQENLDLKLTPYKVIATGLKEGFLQFVDALPLSKILIEYKSVKEYLCNPFKADRNVLKDVSIKTEVMENYVRSCGK